MSIYNESDNEYDPERDILDDVDKIGEINRSER